LKTKDQISKGSNRQNPPESQLSLPTVEEQGILESYSKLPPAERDIIRRLLENFSQNQVAVIRLPVPFGAKQVKERREFLLPIYRLIRYHRLIFDSIADGALRSTYLPWIESITHIKAGEKEELELRLNSNYEKVWRKLKERLEIEPGGRLKSQYSSRLYQWARQHLAVGHRRVSLATLRKIFGLEDIRDASGKLVQQAPLEAWANLKQRALDHALKEINKHSDIELEVEFTGRGNYRKVHSLGFRIKAKKDVRRREGAQGR
jgi:hypothetical protein